METIQLHVFVIQEQNTKKSKVLSVLKLKKRPHSTNECVLQPVLLHPSNEENQQKTQLLNESQIMYILGTFVGATMQPDVTSLLPQTQPEFTSSKGSEFQVGISQEKKKKRTQPRLTFSEAFANAA